MFYRTVNCVVDGIHQQLAIQSVIVNNVVIPSATHLEAENLTGDFLLYCLHEVQGYVVVRQEKDVDIHPK